MTKKINSVLIIGMGLIGSSISRALTEYQVANNVYGLDANDKVIKKCQDLNILVQGCLLYTSPSPRDATLSRMPSSA